MSKISDEALLAYLDGELDSAQGGDVEAALEADPGLRARLDAHRTLSDAARGAFAGVLSEPMPARLVVAVKRRPKRPQVAPPWWAAMAACLAVGVLIGRFGLVDQSPLEAEPGGLAAQGQLAKALQTAPSAGGGPVRIGLSFRSAKGYCRTFDMTAEQIGGLACREQGTWRVVLTAQSMPQGGAYRMAGSAAPPAVLQAVDALIVGAPLDRAQEDAARRAGWR